VTNEDLVQERFVVGPPGSRGHSYVNQVFAAVTAPADRTRTVARRFLDILDERRA
jgi:hypothetical protein